jgi:hypothetical protein
MQQQVELLTMRPGDATTNQDTEELEQTDPEFPAERKTQIHAAIPFDHQGLMRI